MTKRNKVKLLLEIMSQIPTEKIPVKDSSIDMDKFGEMEETKALIVFLKMLGVKADDLSDMGFMPAYMIYARFLE